MGIPAPDQQRLIFEGQTAEYGRDLRIHNILERYGVGGKLDRASARGPGPRWNADSLSPGGSCEEDGPRGGDQIQRLEYCSVKCCFLLLKSISISGCFPQMAMVSTVLSHFSFKASVCILI